jgi:hypothetical protein
MVSVPPLTPLPVGEVEGDAVDPDGVLALLVGVVEPLGVLLALLLLLLLLQAATASTATEAMAALCSTILNFTIVLLLISRSEDAPSTNFLLSCRGVLPTYSLTPPRSWI